jgi:tetratricopeptide (TPR) repeat protein
MKIPAIIFASICFLHFSAAAQSEQDRNKLASFFHDQQYDEAIELLKNTAAEDSNKIDWISNMGYAQYMNDSKKAAEHYFQRAFEMDSSNVSAIQYLAALRFSSNRESAMDMTERLILLQPDKASWYRRLAELYNNGNMADSSFRYFNIAYAMNSRDPKNGWGLANFLLDAKKYGRADSIIQTALGYDSLSDLFLKLAVRSAYEQEKFEDAIVPGEKLILLGENSVNTMNKLALAYYNLKRYKDCIRVCQYLIDQGMTLESVFYYQAKALAKLNEYAESNDLLEICLSTALSNKAEIYLYNKASNYGSLKQYRKAIAYYDTAYYLFKNPVMKYNCGRIYETNLHDLTNAKKNYQLYLAKAKPETAEEKKAFAYVQSVWGKPKAKKAIPVSVH